MKTSYHSLEVWTQSCEHFRRKKKIKEEQEKEVMNIAIAPPYQNMSLTNLRDLSASN